MKLTKTILLILPLLVVSCCRFVMKVPNMLSEQEGHYWSGSDGTNNYALYVTETSDKFYKALLLKSNLADSISAYYLRGFEKGRTHPTKVRTTSKRGNVKHIMIYSMGAADTLSIRNSEVDTNYIPKKLYLFKQQKPIKSKKEN